MRTNIIIDEDLITDFMAASGARTKREAVDMALRDGLRIKRQLQAWDGLRGTGWDGDLDAMRTSRHIASE